MIDRPFYLTMTPEAGDTLEVLTDRPLTLGRRLDAFTPNWEHALLEVIPGSSPGQSRRRWYKTRVISCSQRLTPHQLVRLGIVP